MLDRQRDKLVRADEEWASLNQPEFRYGSGGDRVWHDPETAYGSTSPPAGFVSLYATMGAEEDKAETFAFLLASPACYDSTDSIAQAKIELMLKRIMHQCPMSRLTRGCT